MVFLSRWGKWQVFADDGWKGLTGSSAQWTAEIFNKEDDMPGTATEKCSFSECQIKLLESKEYESPKLIKSEVKTHDAKEWGSERISDDSFNIWDIHPLW